MSKFNKKTEEETMTTYEGGTAYKKNPVQDWINFIFSSYLENGFYEDSDAQMRRFIDLTNEIGESLGWEFVAKTAGFVRNDLGLRSVSELVAAILNGHQFENKRAFFRNYFHRPDGVAEVFAAIDMLEGKRSHALIRGAGDYLSTLGEYQLGKYKMSGKEYNLYDLINLTHAHSSAIDKYKQDLLEAPETWEVKVSTAKNREEQEEAWKDMLFNKKFGYLALIRNVNNLLKCSWFDEEALSILCKQLTNKTAIKKSLIFPYQIYVAWKNCTIRSFELDKALSDAFTIACGNMPELPGKNVIILDVSGSMSCPISYHSNLAILEVGAVYATALYLKTNADIVKFGTEAKYIESYNKLDNVFSMISKMCENSNCGHGTDISKAFMELTQKYDRIFLISDMQTMELSSLPYYIPGENFETPKEAFNFYKKFYGANPVIYSFDLGNYPSQVTSSNQKIHYVTTLNDKVFEIIPFLESGSSIVDYINENYSYC